MPAVRHTTREFSLSVTDPPVLLAVLIAARKTGDELVERAARSRLQRGHGIEVRFTAESYSPAGCEPTGVRKP